MDYQQTLEYLYTSTPMFQSIGADAYKPGLETVLKLSEMFGNPHLKLRTIHIAGTNGKGSTAHTIAAVLQSAGYRTGLFTSPHLTDFRERIRIDGKMIPRDEVTGFVDRFIAGEGERLHPSFFELTTIMAFDYFARNNVDVAVIEVGLGGRLDSTNIITPELSIITNISRDHTALLGNSEEEIAGEKAGIIKDGVPVVIGESAGKVRDVFRAAAERHHAPICHADDLKPFASAEMHDDGIALRGTRWGDLTDELCGDCQLKNAATILCTLERMQDAGFSFTSDDVARGFGHVCEMTGLTGRWMKVGENPTVICDTGHNTGGWQYLAERLASYGNKLHMVIGFVNDKDISGILAMMPREPHYYFVKPSVPRGLDSALLRDTAAACGLKGEVFQSVADGYKAALSRAEEGDTVFVGGSTFVVADLIILLNNNNSQQPNI